MYNGAESAKKMPVQDFFDCIWWRSGIDILANSCKFFTYTMWKYIIIAAVVLFLGACFLFYKNNEALTGPEGEVAAYQSQFDMAKKKAVDIEKDKAIKRYAELRTAYFKQQCEQYNEERTSLEAEDAPLEQEIAKANADLEAAKADFKRYDEEFKAFHKNAAEAAGDDSGAGEEDLKVIGERIAELVQSNNALEAQAAAEEKNSDSVDEKSVELVKSGAEEAINSLNKLMDEGLFEKGDSDDKDAILDKLNSFVKDYNAMINNAGEMDGENSLKAGVRLVDQMKVYKSALSRIGVSVENDNTLKIDEDAFKESDISDVKNLFTGNVSMAKNIQSKLLQVYSSANMDLKSTDGLYSAQAIKNVTLGSMFDSIT